MANAIEMRGVRKTFGEKVAVSGLDLAVPEGCLLGLIGPNGAGKSTSIRMIMSILFPDEGQLSVLGRRSAVESKDRIGYLPEERGVYKKMKVGAFLRHVAALKNVPSSRATGLIGEWLERVQLPGVWGKKCEELSKGMQQKVQFIASVLHKPELVILDEPFSGLDPVNLRLLRDVIGDLHRQGTTVIFSTHVMVHAEQVCDRIVMIHRGEKVLDGTMDEIRRGHEVRSVLFEPWDPRAGELAMSAVAAVPGVAGVLRGEAGLEATLGEGDSPTAVLGRVAQAFPLRRVELRRPTLEDVFVEIVSTDRESSAEETERLRAAVRAGATGE